MNGKLKLIIIIAVFILITSYTGSKEGKKTGFGCFGSSDKPTNTDCTIQMKKDPGQNGKGINMDTCQSLGSTYACYIKGLNPIEFNDVPATGEWITYSGKCVKVSQPIFT